MRHLDGVNPGVIQRPGNVTHMVKAIHMANGVHAVAQGHVLDIEFLSVMVFLLLRRPG